MIITLRGADFSTNNINDLIKNWSIVLKGGGLTSTGPSSVLKDSALDSFTITVDTDNYTFDGTVTVTMGGNTVSNAYSISGNVITINKIEKVTSKVEIIVGTTKNIAGGEEEPETPVTPTSYTFTINPDPTSSTVTLAATGYSTVSGTGNQSITVANGTEVNWSVSADGYTTRTGTWTISGGNKTESIVLTATSGDETGVSFSDDDFEIGAWTAAGAPVELDSRFRTKTTKRFNRDVTFNAVTLPNTTGPTSLRFISNGSQTNWINDSYTVPANTEFHLILARAGQTGAVDITKSITVPEGATKLYVNSLKDQKTDAFAIVNGVTYSGSDFVDKLYHYGENGATMSTLSTSSKAASNQDPIAVTAGETVTIRTFTNGTLGYVFVDDADTIIALGASIEFMSEYFTPTRYFTYE